MRLPGRQRYRDLLFSLQQEKAGTLQAHRETLGLSHLYLSLLSKVEKEKSGTNESSMAEAEGKVSRRSF